MIRKILSSKSGNTVLTQYDNKYYNNNGDHVLTKNDSGGIIDRYGNEIGRVNEDYVTGSNGQVVGRINEYGRYVSATDGQSLLE